MRDTNQVLMFNSQQLALIKSTFADREDLLYTIRNIMLQLPVDKADLDAVKKIMTPEVFEIIQMRLVPELRADAPWSQLSDLYQSLNKDLQEKSYEDMVFRLRAKKIQIAYLEQEIDHLRDLSKPYKPEWKLDNLKTLDVDEETAYVYMLARNFLLSYIDSFLHLLYNLAGAKAETAEQQARRLQRDSNK